MSIYKTQKDLKVFVKNTINSCKDFNNMKIKTEDIEKFRKNLEKGLIEAHDGKAIKLSGEELRKRFK